MSRRRDLVLNPRWAMDLGHLAPFISLYEGVTAGDQEAQRTVALLLSESRREAREAAAAAREGGTADLGYTVKDGVAQASFVGVVTKEPSCMGSLFGGEALTTELIKTVQAITQDPNVRRTMLRFDSPGGTVDGVAAAAEVLHRANAVKPITAYVDGMACSAAWWLASQCSRVVGDEVATSGSMGVYATLVDTTRAYENRGVKVRLVKSAPGKGAGAPGTPVTDAQVAALQLEVDAVAEVFIQAVARGRGISLEQARAMADGEPYTGARALAGGYLDAIEHYSDTLDALVAEANPPRRFFIGHSQGQASAVPATDSEPTPSEAPTESTSPEAVARLVGAEQEAPMSDSTPKDPQAPEPAAAPVPTPPAPAPASSVASSPSLNDEVVARVNRALDDHQSLRERLAVLEKEKADASTEALLKAHEDKFLPAEAHRAAARTIAASFPTEFALLMGTARAVRPKVGAAPVYQREAGDGDPKTGSLSPGAYAHLDPYDADDAKVILDAAKRYVAANPDKKLKVTEAAALLTRAQA